MIQPRFWAGIDWADRAPNVAAVIGRDGNVVSHLRFASTPDGVQQLCTMFAGLRASHQHSRKHVPIAIETSGGALVHELHRRGQPVYQIPPGKVAKYRASLEQSPRKSDRMDAVLLAVMLRERWGQLRPLPQLSPAAGAITELAYAQRRAQLHREKLQARLRTLLRQAHPAALQAWESRDGGLRRAEARAVLTAAPTATSARKLTPYRIEKVLAPVRLRLIEQESYRLAALFAAPVLHLPPTLDQAAAIEIRTVLALFDHACTVADDLTTHLTERFTGHPHAPIYLSMPGCGALTGARLLAAIGDDPNRFTSARGLRAYAGIAPLTWSSGTSHQVTQRRICNRILKTICHRWAFSSITRSPGTRALYDTRRAAGDTYAAALRRVSARLLGSLHHCLTHDTLYDETIAFPHATSPLD